ncbi:HoxN/HupN/NixA family nickel/cobalt transporter [Georgenia sp. AZ-5]|uniref:HoxN/HupN/NixA family nickel/cobalt transporter n=1 Tax=Georgenia sp. AZ-5 TaxID=3367526 RepID=UPI0037542A9B
MPENPCPLSDRTVPGPAAPDRRADAPAAGGRRRWTGAEKRSLAGMVAVVVLLNVVGWGVLLLAVAPQGLVVGNAGVFGVGLGVTAFLLGVRHAFDADHIAAIDNTTRKLVGERRPALSVGFWFSLGHSSVVFGLAVLLALGVQAIAGHVVDENSTLQQTLGLVGTVVAGTFLILIGLLNLGSVRGIVKVFRELRGAPLDEAELERHLNSRGLLARLLGRFTRRVSRPWHMYPVGLLMGLGFDTATQVALLVLAGGTAALTLPWYAILVLPVLFAAGMSLFDAADGVVMARAYRWAFLAPVRKVYYNLTVTVLSVLAALGVGSVVLLQLLAEHVRPTGGLLGEVAALDLGNVGYVLVGLFVATWLVSIAVWRWGRLEDRWQGRLAQG